MIVTILDDYSDTSRTLVCFSKARWLRRDHVERSSAGNRRSGGALGRDGGSGADPRADENPDPVARKLPNLKLISQPSVYPHIDIDTCTQLRIVVSSDLHVGTPSYATAELTWALLMLAMREIPQQMA